MAIPTHFFFFLLISTLAAGAYGALSMTLPIRGKALQIHTQVEAKIPRELSVGRRKTNDVASGGYGRGLAKTSIKQKGILELEAQVLKLQQAKKPRLLSAGIGECYGPCIFTDDYNVLPFCNDEYTCPCVSQSQLQYCKPFEPGNCNEECQYQGDVEFCVDDNLCPCNPETGKCDPITQEPITNITPQG